MSGNPSDIVRKHWEFMAAYGSTQPSLAELRDTSDHEWTKLTAEPRGVDYIEGIDSGTNGLWLLPKNRSDGHVLLCFHGGGFIGGSIYTHRKMYGHLAKAVGSKAFNAAYGLVPEHVFPSQLNEAIAAYRALLDDGIEPAHVLFVGDSAGGGLVLSALMKARDEGLPLPAGAMTISAWTDMAVSGPSYETNRGTDPFFTKEGVSALAGMYLGAASAKDPAASPLYGDLRGLPPLMMQVGGDEALLSDTQRFVERAKEAAVEAEIDVYPGMLHSFQMAAGRMPQADAAIACLARWARSKLGLGDRAEMVS